MPLTCGCDYEPDPGDTCWYTPDGYSRAPTLGRRQRCTSCGRLIVPGSVTASFPRFKIPESDIEERIHGDQIPRAPAVICEECADLYFSFQDLGFECVSPFESMRDLAKEYAGTYGPKVSEIRTEEK